MVKSRLLAIFAAILLAFPWMLAAWHFDTVLARNHLLAESLIESSLNNEMNRFRINVSGRACVEAIIKAAERELRLTSENLPQDFSTKNDPLIFTTSTPERFAAFIDKNYGIRPSYFLSLGFNGEHLARSFYGQHTRRSPEMYDLLTRLTVFSIVSRIMPPLSKIPEFVGKFTGTREGNPHEVLDPGKEAINNILRLFFSGLCEFPRAPGVCFEVATSRIGGRSIYIYTNAIFNRGKFFGGFFVVFSGADLSPAFLAENALRQVSPEFSISFVPLQPGMIGMMRSDKEHFYLYSRLPVDFSDSGAMAKISVSRQLAGKDLFRTEKKLSFAKRTLILIFYSFFLFCIFGKTKLSLSLRRKFLLINTLVVMAPFLLMAYFAGQLLENMENLSNRQIETEASLRMFEVTRYVEDLRIKRQLATLSVKKAMADKTISNGIDFEGLKSCPIPDSMDEEINYASVNGKQLVFSHDIRKTEMRKMTSMMSTSYLNNLGLLRLDLEANRRALEVVNLAGGFLEDLRRDYLEGRSLAYESQETKDLTELNDLHRMLYFLIPDMGSSDRKICGIGFVHFWDIGRFGDVLKKVSAQRGFPLWQKNEKAIHRFAIGERAFEGSPDKVFPENISEKDSLRLMVEQAALTRSSGQTRKSVGGMIEVHSWRFFSDRETVYAGVSQAIPDYFLIYLSGIFPLFIGVFSLISLILISEAFAEMMVKPIKYFFEFIGSVEREEYNVEIVIDRGDEFSALAGSFNSMAVGLGQSQKMRRFISQRLCETLQHGDGCGSVGESEMSVLAADIRGFTSLSEKYDAQVIVDLLNKYFTEMGCAIKENGGIIERFVGDAVIAVFYADTGHAHHALNAINAAVQMRKNLHRFNRQRAERGNFNVENGIGIVSGKAWTAISGAGDGRKVFSIFGQVVNEAETLEARSSGHQDGKIVLCAKTAAVINSPELFRLRQIDEECYLLIEDYL